MSGFSIAMLVFQGGSSLLKTSFPPILPETKPPNHATPLDVVQQAPADPLAAGIRGARTPDTSRKARKTMDKWATKKTIGEFPGVILVV